MTDTAKNYIDLEDNSDRDSNRNMADKEEQQQQPEEGQDQSQEQGQDQQAQTQSKQSGGSWYEKPENMGNSAGDWVQNKLSPVGNVAGKGLETVGRPVGGIVDPLVGGLMRSGEGFGDMIGVGFGNKEGGPAAQREAEGERMKQPVAGLEQTGDNPLGLNPKAT